MVLEWGGEGGRWVGGRLGLLLVVGASYIFVLLTCTLSNQHPVRFLCLLHVIMVVGFIFLKL